MRIAIVGYGTGGKNFHAPFIEAATGVDLVAVVARSDTKKAEVAADLPGIPTFDSLTALIDSGLLTPGVDAVTITTPPQSRRELVLEAIAAGLHVVADKPFAPTAADGAALEHAAEAAGVTLSVYHNRRFDSDIQTLAAVIASGELGDLWRVHSRMDQDDPATLEAGPTGGLLRDLGTHVVDQMMWLLGDVEQVFCSLDSVDLPEGTTDASFVVTLQHTSGVTSYVEASKVNHVTARTLRAYGSLGSYEASSVDIQAESIFAGVHPSTDRATWGFEEPSTLNTASGPRAVTAQQGAYFEFYERFAAAVAGSAPAPSPASEGVRTLAVLDAARRSAASGTWERP